LSFTVKAGSDAKSGSESEPSDSQTDEVLREWRESAFYWQKHIDLIRVMFAPLTQALIDEAGIVEGDSVLDIAGGAGEPSLTIAQTVGSIGSVTCTDAIEEMVEAARSEAQRRGICNVAFRQCKADSLPFESETFDAVVCRLGAMFFRDPLAAFREMLRVTKSRGAMSLAVWDKSELNPFSYVVTSIVARYVEAPSPEPSVPGAFRFAEAGVLAQLLREAGASDVKERVLKFHIAAPVSPKTFWEMRSETSGTLREKLATLPPLQANLIAEETQQAVREFFPNEHMSFPAQMIIVSGRKP
jgi:ubiquinone/menaquinone biosynthesis C-methylase UbiE